MLFYFTYAYLQFTPSITFAYFRYYVNIGYINTRTNVKSSIVPEEGWFGQPKYSTLQKIILRCVGFCFCILQVDKFSAFVRSAGVSIETIQAFNFQLLQR